MIDQILAVGLRANRHFGNLVVLAGEREAFLGYGAAENFGGFGEALAGFAHRDAKSLELDAARAAAKPQSERTALQEIVEQRKLFGYAHRVMPREHDHHRAET